jgi:hypothetical protein
MATMKSPLWPGQNSLANEYDSFNPQPKEA